jgi:multidrug efflux pump subunit AcrA (membrane-fusion protein)
MRWQVLAIVGLLVVGLGAVGLAVFGPGLAGNRTSNYLTSPVTRTDVVDQAVANGTISAAVTYGLSFDADPHIVSDSSSSAGGSGSWLVKNVNVSVGQKVTVGDVLALADDSDAQAALQLAQANLEAAQARYDTDSGGLSETDQQSAQLSVTQAEQQLTSAKQSRTETLSENRIRISQSESSVTAARQQLADDQDAAAPDNVIQADKDALQQAKDSLALLRVQVDAQNRQAQDQVDSAQLALDQANNGYASQTEPASAEVLASDRASLLQAQQSLADAQDAVDAATLSAPIEGTVVAVNLVVGTTAPSGDSIQIMGTDMQVTTQFAESDLPSLALGQQATVTVSATGDALTGTLTSIDPVASTSAGSSVVSYPVTIALTGVPATVLPGMSAEVAVTVASAPNVLAIAATALNGSAGNYSVQVIDGSGALVTRQVQVGLVTSSLAEIKSGLSEGDDVVIGTTSSTTSGNGFPGGGGVFPGGGGFRQVVTNP